MEQDKSVKKKWWKWVAGIVTALLLIGTGAGYYLLNKWKPILSEKIQNGISDGSYGLYRLNFKDIHLNLLTGTASIDEAELNPDTAVFFKLKKLGTAPAHVFQVKVKKLQINHIGLLNAYFRKKINISSIVLDQPSINMVHYTIRKRKDSLKPDVSLFQLISKKVKSIRVNAIRIVNADFDYINGETSKPLNRIKNLNLNVKDLLIDSLSQFDTTRFYYTKDIGFELTGYQSKDKMYQIKADTISGSATGKTIRIQGLKMIPLYPELEFSRMSKYGKDRYDLNFSQISFSGVDFLRLNEEEEFHAKTLKIGPAKVNIFLNREMPPVPNLDKAKNFPHMALKRAPIPSTIDEVKLDNIDLAYTEYNPISQKKGTIYFQNLNGKISNLTNDSLSLIKNNHAIARINAMVMKKAKIDLRIDFNLSSRDGSFNYSGNVGPMDLTELNTVSKPLGLIEIEEGRMQKADFNFSANRSGSAGKVHFYYTGLKLKLLKEGENGEAPKKKGLLSFLANNLLIIDANPSKGEAVRTANVTFQRSPAASFFNLLWKGLFIGMRETAGLGIVPVKTPEKAMEAIKDKKKERQEKSRERKEK
ncbi:AsmA family protein [Pedobacter caeni]|uniref:DUF748 domain-containing protein n=1 Tax=Pedobacter caeni TaxID=288992 RepID=A0A1M5DBT4_9SPHI|nr:hypothetical protein [Pedobacter caeni]SHF64314.1 hypothetical protein SAMN04488522_103159 [Pedobacter caeni]